MEELKDEMEQGEKAENVYSEEGRGKKSSCAECGKQIAEDDENIIEREFDGEVKWFCCSEHADNYAKKYPSKENPERVED